MLCLAKMEVFRTLFSQSKVAMALFCQVRSDRSFVYLFN